MKQAGKAKKKRDAKGHRGKNKQETAREVYWDLGGFLWLLLVDVVGDLCCKAKVLQEESPQMCAPMVVVGVCVLFLVVINEFCYPCCCIPCPQCNPVGPFLPFNPTKHFRPFESTPVG